VLNHIISYHIT